MRCQPANTLRSILLVCLLCSCTDGIIGSGPGPGPDKSDANPDVIAIDIDILSAQRFFTAPSQHTAVGITFLEGDMEGQVAGDLRDGQGQSVPYKAEVIAWWSAQKRFVKHAVLRFVASEEERYAFHWKELAPANDPPSMLQSDDSSLTIDTGKVEVVLSKQNPSLYQSARVGTTTYPAATLVLDSDDGIAREPTQLADWTTEVVRDEGDSVLVRSSGFFRTAGKTTIAKLDLRYEFYKDRDWFNVFHTVTWMVRNPNHGSSLWAIDIPAPDASTFRVGYGENSSDHFSYGTTAPIRASQLEVDGLSVYVGDALADSATHLAGWAAAERDTGTGVAVALRHAWQTYPTEFSFQEHTMRVSLWPQSAPRMAFRYSDIMPDELYFSDYWENHEWSQGLGHAEHEYVNNPYFEHTAEGAARTHEFAVQFYDSDSALHPAELNSIVQHPVIARQDPKHATKIPIQGLDIAPIGTLPEVIETALDSLGKIVSVRPKGGHYYGFWRFGMVRWGAPPESGLYRWFDNAQYSQQVIPWILFIRGGDRSLYEEGEILSRYHMDVGTNHYTTRDGASPGYMGAAAIAPFPWYAGGLSKAPKIHFLRHFLHLSGDLRTREVLDRVIDFHANHALSKPAGKRSWGRELYNGLRVLHEMYEATWDPRIKELAQEWTLLALGREYHPDYQSFRNPQGYLYQGLLRTIARWQAEDWGTLTWDASWEGLRDPDGQWGLEDAQAILLTDLQNAGFPDMPWGGVKKITRGAAVQFGYQVTGDPRWIDIGWDLACGLSGIVPHHQSDISVEHYPYLLGNGLYEKQLLPILAGASLGVAHGKNNCADAVRQDLHMGLTNPDGQGFFGKFHLRPTRDGELSVKIHSMGYGDSGISPALQVTILRNGAVERDDITLPAGEPVVLDPERYLLRDSTSSKEITLTNVKTSDALVFEVRAIGEEVALVALVSDADTVYEVPSATWLALRPQDGDRVNEATTRMFLRTTEETTTVRNEKRMFLILDANTGEELYRTPLATHPEVSLNLGANRDIVLVSLGNGTYLRTSGISPFVATKPNSWFEPR